MKNLFALLFVAATLVACGPSEADKKAQAAADSTRVADSLAKVQKEADSLAALAVDTTAKVDTAAVATK